MRRLLLVLGILLGLSAPAAAQITIPNTFTPFTLISASALNANFTTVGQAALNRTGGTITGNISVDADVTIDGADISDYLTGGRLVATSTAANSLQTAGGITAAGVAIVGTDGKIPAISSTYFLSLSGANLTSLPAGQLTGTIASAVQDNITRLGTVTSGTFSGTLGAISGATLTNLNASNISTGTLATARMGSGTADATTYLRGDQTWATISIPDIPSNIIGFSSTASCPTGWSEYTAGRGFAFVGLPASGTNAGTVGTAMTNLENRTHTHSIPSLHVDGLSYTTSSNGAHGHTGTTSGPSGTTSVDSTGVNVASSTHTHTFSSDVNGAHTHSGTTNSGSTDTGTTGSASASSVISYIQLMACKKD